MDKCQEDDPEPLDDNKPSKLAKVDRSQPAKVTFSLQVILNCNNHQMNVKFYLSKILYLIFQPWGNCFISIIPTYLYFYTCVYRMFYFPRDTNI